MSSSPVFCLGTHSWLSRLISQLQLPQGEVQYSQFSAGEWSIQTTLPAGHASAIVCGDIPADSVTLFQATCLSAALRAQGATHLTLIAPWIAYGCQDRFTKHHEAPAGLVVGHVLARAFDRIITFDAHSNAFIQSFEQKLTNVYADLLAYPDFASVDVIIAPDKGAQTRAVIASEKLQKPMLCLEKTRATHQISSCLSDPHYSLRGKTALLIDDMADSGGTLKAAAETLRNAGATHIFAFIPHALSLSKLQARTANMIDRIECAYNHESGEITDHQLSLLIQALKTP